MTAQLYFGQNATPHASIWNNAALSGLSVVLAQRKTYLNYTLTLSNDGDQVVVDYIRLYARWHALADIEAHPDDCAYATLYGTSPIVQWQAQNALALNPVAWTTSGQCTITKAFQDTLLVVATVFCSASNQGVTLAAITQDQCAAVNTCP